MEDFVDLRMEDFVDLVKAALAALCIFRLRKTLYLCVFVFKNKKLCDPVPLCSNYN